MLTLERINHIQITSSISHVVEKERMNSTLLKYNFLNYSDGRKPVIAIRENYGDGNPRGFDFGCEAGIIVIPKLKICYTPNKMQANEENTITLNLYGKEGPKFYDLLIGEDGDGLIQYGGEKKDDSDLVDLLIETVLEMNFHGDTRDLDDANIRQTAKTLVTITDDYLKKRYKGFYLSTVDNTYIQITE